MDHITIDVTDVAEAAEGDEVVLWGRARGGRGGGDVEPGAEGGAGGGAQIDVMELALRAGTIGYELLTRIGGRVERVAEHSAGGRG